jgi:GH15 family glucan-1,4-alpha-glucosidase
MNLRQHSIDVILLNQAESGAFVACPTFPTYGYCWFRDGSFIAHSMDVVGEFEASRRFHEWAASTLLARRDLVRRCLRTAAAQGAVDPTLTLRTRYRLDGADCDEQEWPNFQLDGFGTWLWGMEQHARRSGETAPDRWVEAADLVAAYLAALWRQPCYDCWEEHGDKVHPSTLAALYAGLGAASRITGRDWRPAQEAIRAHILDNAIYDGYVVKFVGSHTVDSSLLSLGTPYDLLAIDDPVMVETVRRIDRSLARDGGVRRYPTDTYYGGGQWVLLTAWLGWHHARAGNLQRATQLLEWVRSAASPQGDLPEQVACNLVDENYLKPWESLWGQSASPLLWSHAMHLILEDALAS